MTTFYPACDSSYTSIVDGLKSIGVDSSFNNRKVIASINDISNYSGTESQNIELLKKLKQGKLIKSKSSNPSSSSSSSNEMIKKLEQSSVYASKKSTLSMIGTLLFNNGYPPSFVAGVLGNVYHEGKIGFFESSAYSNPDRKPQYLKYMDELYQYAEKYSGKIVTEVSMNKLDEVMNKLKADKWEKGKFGLGCIQWTGERTYTLFKLYKQECGGADSININQAITAEGKMVMNELKGSYEYIYKKWDNENPNKNTQDAAYNAASILCLKYEVPYKKEENAIKRGNTAKDIYNIMTS